MDSSDFEVITSDSVSQTAAPRWSEPLLERTPSVAFGWIQPEEFAKDFVKVHDGDPYSQLRLKFWGNQAAFPAGAPPGAPPADNESTPDPCPAETDIVDEDDIRPSCGLIDIDIPSFVDKLFVRADYIRIYDRLEQRRLELTGKGGLKSAPAVGILTGHPGVGKSVWMVYAMLRRLAERKFTVVFLGTYCLVLSEDAVYKFSEFSYLRSLRSDVWVLVDSEYAPDQLPRALVRRNHVAFTIYATFPKEDRWSGIEAVSSVVIVIMNPWTCKEICDLALGMGLELTCVVEAFNLLGPIPRLCIDFHLQGPAYRQRYKQSMEANLHLALQCKSRHCPSGLETWQPEPYNTLGLIDVDQSKLTLSVVSRIQHEDVESSLSLPIITPYIVQRLLIGKGAAMSSDTISSLKFYTTSPKSAPNPVILELRSFVSPQTWYHYSIAYPNSGPRARSTDWSEYGDDGSDHLGGRRILLDSDRGWTSVNIPCQPGSTSPSTAWYYDRPPEHIIKNTFYVQTFRLDRLLDSFIIIDGQLYIFRVTMSRDETLSTELLAFFEGYDCIPPYDCCSIIFLIPSYHSLFYTFPRDEKLEKISPCFIPVSIVTPYA